MTGEGYLYRNICGGATSVCRCLSSAGASIYIGAMSEERFESLIIAVERRRNDGVDVGPTSRRVAGPFRTNEKTDNRPIFKSISPRYRADMKCFLGYIDLFRLDPFLDSPLYYVVLSLSPSTFSYSVRQDNYSR